MLLPPNVSRRKKSATLKADLMLEGVALDILSVIGVLLIVLSQ